MEDKSIEEMIESIENKAKQDRENNQKLISSGDFRPRSTVVDSSKKYSGLLSAIGIQQKFNMDRGDDKIEYEVEIPSDYVTVDEAFESKQINKQYEKVFEGFHTCGCGAPIMLRSFTLTGITCSNLRCSRKIAASILKFAKKFSIAGIGKETSLSLVRDRGYLSILDFIERPPMDYIEDIDAIRELKLPYNEWVQNMCIYTLDLKAITIFDNISSYNEYRAMVDNYGSLEDFISSRIGGYKDAINYARILNAYDYELRHLEKVLGVRKQAELVIPIAMTGDVMFKLPELGINRFTKLSYLNLINTLYPDYIKFEKTESVSKAMFVLADYKTSNRKYLEGEEQDKIISYKIFSRLIGSTEIFFKLLFPDTWEEKCKKLRDMGVITDSKTVSGFDGDNSVKIGGDTKNG